MGVTLPGLVFDSTESVVEVLWDIAIAVFVIRLAFFYTIFTALGVTLFFWAAPQVQMLVSSSPTPSPLVLAVHAVGIPALCASAINILCGIPRVSSYRLAIGAMSLVYMALGGLLLMTAPAMLPASWAEGVAGHCSRSSSPATSHSNNTHDMLAGVFLTSVMLMPWLSMKLPLEQWWVRRTAHKQPLTPTSPTVSSEKNQKSAMSA